MKSIKLKTTISSTTLKIEELKNRIGKEVEITIKETAPQEKAISSDDVAGMLSEYGNPNLVAEENLAWSKAVKEKHERY